jgi:hypothetical protein
MIAKRIDRDLRLVDLVSRLIYRELRLIDGDLRLVDGGFRLVDGRSYLLGDKLRFDTSRELDEAISRGTLDIGAQSSTP